MENVPLRSTKKKEENLDLAQAGVELQSIKRNIFQWWKTFLVTIQVHRDIAPRLYYDYKPLRFLNRT